MRGGVEPAALEIETDPGGDVADKPLLVGNGVALAHERVIGLPCRSRARLHEGHDLVP